MWEWPATLTDVHDGDTVTVTIDRGFEEQRLNMKLRLEGVFAPELKQTGGAETRQFLVDLLAAHTNCLVVQTVRLKNGKRELKTLERYVARLSCGLDGANLNATVANFITTSGYPRGVGG